MTASGPRGRGRVEGAAWLLVLAGCVALLVGRAIQAGTAERGPDVASPAPAAAARDEKPFGEPRRVRTIVVGPDGKERPRP